MREPMRFIRVLRSLFELLQEQHNKSDISFQPVVAQTDRQFSIWMIRGQPSTGQSYSQWMRGWIKDKSVAEQRATLPALDRKSYRYSVLSLIAQALLRDRAAAESG
ncbi:hypothetical protein DPX16_18770 [Anabarilius grahami]|uniref:Uncharacterized protein n=1 Tax=Anabarilius grahami TaxID=495550 RepID=A0A3N0Y351_ANAGA|nr:hypothetical protein DPX16_18770 [Anabarilius grahami]